MKRIYYLFFCFLLAGVHSSCKKILELTPTSGPTNDAYWQNANDCETAIAGAYSLLRTSLTQAGSTVGITSSGRSMKHYILQDLRCGSYLTTSGYPLSYGLNYLGTTSMYTTTYNLGYGDWSKDYKTIAYCNLILQKVAAMTDAQLSDVTNPTTYRNKILGEAAFIRAYTYFTMVQYWGDVPLVTTYYDDLLDAPQIARTNKDTVLALVESDCLSALNKLGWPSSYSSSQLAVRATKGSAYALLAHMYLWQGTVRSTATTANDLTLVAKASAATDSVLTSNQYTLTDTSNYLSAYTGNSKESLFEINMLSSDNEASQYHLGISFLQGTKYLTSITTSPYYYYNSSFGSNIFTTTEKTQDVRYRRGFYYDTTTTTSRYVPLKYSNVVALSTTSTSVTNGLNNNMVIYRLAEMQLLKAEIYIYQGNYTAALAIINANRLRNGIPAASTLTLPTTNVYSTMITYYMKERVKELFFEGTLFNDMLRTKAFGTTYSSYFTSWMTADVYNSGGLYLPVYPDLFLNNPLLVQNNYYIGKF